MTLAFWVRLLRGGNDLNGVTEIMIQGAGGAAGVNIVVVSSTQLCIEIELNTYYWRLCHNSIPQTVFREWFFLSVLFDPTTSALVSFLNEKRVVGSTTNRIMGTAHQLLFGGNQKFLLDDVLFFPKFSTDEMISTFYNTSK